MRVRRAVIIDLLLRFRDCRELLQYIDMTGIDVAGIEVTNSEALQCFERLSDARHTVVLIPRLVFESNRDRLAPRAPILRRFAVSCIPRELSVARSLAKIAGLYTIALTPDTIMYVDETQINLMYQIRSRKFIEIYLYDFIATLFEEKKISTERLMYYLGETIERAIKRDVGIFISSASRDTKRAIHPRQIDALLHALGFTKRERRLLLEVYPLEFVNLWLRI